jgi:hypothetical protein
MCINCTITINYISNQLLVIKNLADNYPNSGSLNKALNNFDKDLGHKIKNKRVALTTGFPSLCFLSTNLNSSPSQSIPILATIAILCSHKCISVKQF